MLLDLEPYQGKLKFSDDKRHIYDPVRRKYVLKKPEEIVRQTWIQYLHFGQDFSYKTIQVEKKVGNSKSAKRFDLIVYDTGIPWILFELKSFNTKLTHSTCSQIAGYNMTLKVPHIIISNGIEHYAYQVNFEKHLIKNLDKFPRIDK